jgi:hypothetical protein
VVLVEAFTAAGAESVTNFQTNGTVIFSAADPTEVVERVRPLLLAATGYEDVVVVRSHAWLAELGPRLDPELHGGEVALFDAAEVPALELPWVDGAGEVACRGIPTRIRLATRLSPPVDTHEVSGVLPSARVRMRTVRPSGRTR